MQLFFYRAKDEKGKEITGKAESESKEALAERLTKGGHYVVEIRPGKSSFAQTDLLEAFRGISAREYILLLAHLSAALDAGLPILKILEAISARMENTKLRHALQDVHVDLTGGGSFSAALRKHPRIFPPYFSSMVSVGENTGHLSESLKKLSIYLEKDEEFKQKTVSIMIYPAILITVTTGVIIFLMSYIMPKFIAVFESSKVPLPLPTLILVGISGILRGYWYYILGGLIAMGFILRFFISTKQGRLKLDTFKLRLPLMGKLFKQIYIVRFLTTFATLYSSGIPIADALILVEDNIGNAVFARTINKLREGVREGRGIAEFLRADGLFPSDSLMMIASGEESGKLPDMLSRTAELYEKDTDYLLKTFAAIMEPMIIIVMGVTIGFVALGILMPIFKMSTAAYH